MPIECWRLQGFTNEQFHKVEALGMSDAQLYKQAGNAVTTTTIKILYSPNNDFAVDDEVKIFTAGTGWGENLDRDKEYLLLFDEWEDVYKYSCGMDSIFEIASDFTVTSRSVFEATSKLDTLSLTEAVSVLDNAIKDKQALQ